MRRPRNRYGDGAVSHMTAYSAQQCVGCNMHPPRKARRTVPTAHPKPNKSQVRKMRQFVYRRDNWTCQKCGKSMRPDDESSYDFNYAPRESGIYLEMDHIIPRSRGGPYTPANLVSACTPCNVKKNVSFCDATWQQRIDYAIDVLQSGAGDETTALRAIEILSSTIK